MLTQFSQFKQGSDIAQGIRRAVVTGKGLSLERLSLLLQVVCNSPAGQKLPFLSISTICTPDSMHLHTTKHAFALLKPCIARLFGEILVFF